MLQSQEPVPACLFGPNSRVLVQTKHKSPTEERMLGGILVYIAVVLIVFLVPAILQLLWNITMPEVFGLKPIRYWIAFRLLIIAEILFSPSYMRFH
jgi:hypothetical protein